MKVLRSLKLLVGVSVILLFLSSNIVFASKPLIPPKKPRPQPNKLYTLTVESGFQTSKSGQYAPGTVVEVMAAYSSDRVFKQWTGSGAKYLEDRHAQRTKLTMPKQNISLKPEYEISRKWEVVHEIIPTTHGTQESPGKSPVYYYIPKNCRGVIICCHGTGGGAELGKDRLEFGIFLRAAVNRGFGYISTSSYKRGEEARWDVTNPGEPKPNSGKKSSQKNPNKDVQNILDILNYLRAKNILPKNVPLMAIGISQGCSFVSILGAYLGLDGAAYSIASGLSAYISSSYYKAPSVFCLAANDTRIGKEGLEKAQENLKILKSRGILSEMYINQPQLVYPHRFMVLQAFKPDFSTSDSEKIHAALVKAGFINPDYTIAITNTADDGFPSKELMQALPPEYREFFRDIKNTLIICRADHHFSSDHTHRILQIFSVAGGKRTRSAVVVSGEGL